MMTVNHKPSTIIKEPSLKRGMSQLAEPIDELVESVEAEVTVGSTNLLTKFIV